jgi:general secretion pathway protein A
MFEAREAMVFKVHPEVKKVDAIRAVLAFYGLAEQPFGVSPDPRFLFLSPTHREALASVLCCVSSGRGFTALIAKPGMGKTTLLFNLLNQLRGQAKTAFLFQSQATPEEFLKNLLEDLKIDNQGEGPGEMQRKLNQCLLREANQGRQVIVAIDEAQNLDGSILEVVRMLSNFEMPREKFLHFILAGQPQLAQKLASPGMLQLRQRISIIARLTPLTADETSLYIERRLRTAGFPFPHATLFTKRAQQMIADYSEGIPRNINNLCFNALSLGFVAKQKTIDADVVREVITDLDLRPMFPDAPVILKSEGPKGPKSAQISDQKPGSPVRTRRSWFGWSKHPRVDVSLRRLLRSSVKVQPFARPLQSS